MTENLNLALQITVVGMGLVFGAILLLWFVMAALVRLTTDKPEAGAPEKAAGSPEKQPVNSSVRKRQAAAAAVAIALAHLSESSEPHDFPLPQTAIVSAWQAVMRSRILNRRGPTR